MRTKMISRALLWLTTLCLVLTVGVDSGQRASAQQTNDHVVGYYAGWASYQGYTPDKIQAELFTQINYAFAAIDGSTGKLVLADLARDRTNLAALVKLKKQNPDLQVVLSVGGWDHSTYFSDVASTAARRETFAQSCLDLILEPNLDGVDLDWEYPVSGGTDGVIHRPQDKQNFTLLLRAIRQKLDRQGQKDGKTYRLTIAGALGSGYLNCIEPQAVADTVDHIFLMAYDIHGPWDSYADLNAPLYTPTESSPQYRYSVDSGVSAWLSKGVASEKLVLGMPLYGYIYQGVSSKNSGLYSSFTSARSVTYNTLKSSYLNNATYQKLRHSRAEVPYLYGNKTFISYDDPTSIAAKAELARSRELGGIGFWELSQDAAGDLIQSACSAWGSSGPFRDVPQSAWYADAVTYVYENGLMNGTAPGIFSPARSVTRGMVAAILYRLEGEPAAPSAPFTDVPAASYYNKAIGWAQRYGVVEGYGDGTFRPDQPVTRQQLAAILWRYARLQGLDCSQQADLDGYRDAGQVEPYAREALGWAVEAGILQGTADGALLPGGTATRSHTAVLLTRFCGVLEAA